MDEDPGRVAFRWLLELRVALVWANCHPYGASCRVVSMTRGENLELIYPTNSGGCRKDKKNADVYLTGTICSVRLNGEQQGKGKFDGKRIADTPTLG